MHCVTYRGNADVYRNWPLLRMRQGTVFRAYSHHKPWRLHLHGSTGNNSRPQLEWAPGLRLGKSLGLRGWIPIAPFGMGLRRDGQVAEQLCQRKERGRLREGGQALQGAAGCHHSLGPDASANPAPPAHIVPDLRTRADRLTGLLVPCQCKSDCLTIDAYTMMKCVLPN